MLTLTLEVQPHRGCMAATCLITLLAKVEANHLNQFCLSSVTAVNAALQPQDYTTSVKALGDLCGSYLAYLSP